MVFALADVENQVKKNEIINHYYAQRDSDKHQRSLDVSAQHQQGKYGSQNKGIQGIVPQNREQKSANRKYRIFLGRGKVFVWIIYQFK
jgi:hypothetical protein